MLARAFRQARTSVADAYPPALFGFSAGDLDRARLAGRLDRLARVADEVRQHPVQLLVIGTDRQARRHVDEKLDRAVGCRDLLAVHHVFGEFGQHEAGQHGRRFLGLAEGERRLAEPDRAADRVDELRRRPLDHRIVAVLHPVGEKLRRRQDVAQVVADLGDGAAKLGEPVLLAQRRGQLLLHHLQRVLRLAQFQDRGLRLDDAPCVLRRLGIKAHAAHDTADGRDEEPPHGKEQEHRRDRRDHRRKRENPQAVLDHRAAQRSGIHRDLDEQTRLLHRVADDAEHTIVRMAEGDERVADQLPGGRIAQVVGLLDRRGDGRGQHQLAHLVAAQDDVVDLGIGEQFLLELLVDHAVGRQERERGDLRAFDARKDVILAKAGDGRHEDQDLRQHDEERRQEQEPT